MTTSTLTQFDFATEEQVLDIFDQLDAIAGGLAITVQESGMDGFVTSRPLMHEL